MIHLLASYAGSFNNTDIAVGTLGLAYGFRNNLADAPIVEGL